MEYTVNRHSTKNLEDIKKEYDEIRRREIEERKQKSLELHRSLGFRTQDEIDSYLKSGGVLGNFFGLCGEIDMTNNFIFLADNDEIHHHSQMSDEFDGAFWMGSRTMSWDDFHRWLGKLEKYKNEEGYFDILGVVKKNPTVKKEDVMNMFKEIHKR